MGNAQGLIQGISGLLEFNYSFFTSETKDATGVTTKTKTGSYNPRFTLNIDTRIFPNLRLHAGGIAELIKTDFDTGRVNTETTITRFRPYIDLTLETPLYTVGVGYLMRQEKTKTEDSPSITLVNEEYNAIFGWRPEGLPIFDMRLKRTKNFDEDKALQDIREDSINLISKYTFSGFQMNYYGTYIHTMDNLNDLDVKLFTHNGRIAYGGSFLNRRVTVNTTYDIFHQEMKTVSEGKGFVTIQVFPFAGLSKIDDTLPPAQITLDTNPALVDGNTTSSAGIDLISNLPLVRRQLGFDFLNPAEVNQILVWVDREITASVASSFLWDIYVSEDNSNWAHWAGPFTATFGPFQNRFEINFPNILPAKRYIKVVTTPLARTTLVPPNLFVTELQAFIKRPAADVEGRVRRTSHLYSLDAKARVLDNPVLFYDFYYLFNKVLPDHQKRYNISNGLSVNHRFSEVFSATARLAREDGEENDEKRVSYLYHASITADPLRTLRNSLVFSGRDEEIGGRPNNINSIFLYNTAQLYQGIDVNLNGGINFAKRETGEKTRDIVISFGANLVPHRTMSIGLNYSDTMSRRKEGGKESFSTYTRRLDFNLNYTPFPTLHFLVLIQMISEKGEKIETVQNYSINWSPFPDGMLQFNVAYNESLKSEDRAKERSFIPSVRWNITKRSYIDLSYQMLKSESKTGKLNSHIISSNLKIFF